MTAQTKSIFQEYYSVQRFNDRYLSDKSQGIDVLIPVLHSNELWRNNLISIYREIPVHRLLIGDGGCIDQTLEIVKKFPRIEIFNHRQYNSLGYSIRKLIEEVKTKWFVYLHSDVYLPPDWFDTMKQHQSQYDWFECRQHLTVLVDYPHDYTNYHRPLSGSQMGRKDAFQNVLNKIDDDYLYRNEDQILVEMLKAQGVRYGRVDETHHYHQMMQKKSAWKRSISKVSMTVDKSPEELEREAVTHVKSIIKYTQPNQAMIDSLRAGMTVLQGLPKFNADEFQAWIVRTNSAWLPFLRRKRVSIPRRLYWSFLAFLRTFKQS